MFSSIQNARRNTLTRLNRAKIRNSTNLCNKQFVASRKKGVKCGLYEKKIDKLLIFWNSVVKETNRKNYPVIQTFSDLYFS